MSDIGTARARPLNRLEQMTYPQLELLLPPNWATRDISERRAAGARTFPELGAPEAYCGAHVAQPLRPVRDSTRPSEVSSRRKPRLCCAPDLFLRSGMKPIAEMVRGTLPQADPL